MPKSKCYFCINYVTYVAGISNSEMNEPQIGLCQCHFYWEIVINSNYIIKLMGFGGVKNIRCLVIPLRPKTLFRKKAPKNHLGLTPHIEHSHVTFSFRSAEPFEFECFHRMNEHEPISKRKWPKLHYSAKYCCRNRDSFLFSSHGTAKIIFEVEFTRRPTDADTVNPCVKPEKILE